MCHQWELTERLGQRLECQWDPSLHNYGMPEIGVVLSYDYWLHWIAMRL